MFYVTFRLITIQIFYYSLCLCNRLLYYVRLNFSLVNIVYRNKITLFIFRIKFILFRAPYSIKCLAPYGGPIIPGLALGGARPENNYLDAVGVTLTFLTNNYLDKAKLEDTLSWEKK